MSSDMSSLELRWDVNVSKIHKLTKRISLNSLRWGRKKGVYPISVIRSFFLLSFTPTIPAIRSTLLSPSSPSSNSRAKSKTVNRRVFESLLASSSFVKNSSKVEKGP